MTHGDVLFAAMACWMCVAVAAICIGGIIWCVNTKDEGLARPFFLLFFALGLLAGAMAIALGVIVEVEQTRVANSTRVELKLTTR